MSNTQQLGYFFQIIATIMFMTMIRDGLPEPTFSGNLEPCMKSFPTFYVINVTSTHIKL